jgi:hypothetical protein
MNATPTEILLCPTCGRDLTSFVVPHDVTMCAKRHAEVRQAEDVYGPPSVLPRVGSRSRPDVMRGLGL